MDVRLAPGGRRASFAVAAPEGRRSALWLLDVGRNIRTRFTFGPDAAGRAVWSPDGSRIAYTTRRADAPAIVIRSSSSAGREEVLVADGVLSRSRQLYHLDVDPGERYDRAAERACYASASCDVRFLPSSCLASLVRPQSGAARLDHRNHRRSNSRR